MVHAMPKTILDHIGNTPLVPLRHISAGLKFPIYGKCEHLNPAGSIKDRLALSVVTDAEQRGVLTPGATMVEATAGNTGQGLALVATVKGYKLVCVLPEKMSADKRVALAQLGARVIVTRNAPPSDPANYQNLARALAQEHGWFLTDQFNNPANPRAHELTTGPEILAQCAGTVAAFVAGVGTGGTISGVGRFLKSKLPAVKVVLADPVGSRLAHMVDSKHADVDGSYVVEGIGSGKAPHNLDLALIDAAEVISDEESFAMTRRLVLEEGLLVGGSSGTNVAAALRYAQRHQPDGPVVTILCDSWDRYRSKPWMQAMVADGAIQSRV